jgi:hypothetical protein
MGDGITAQQLYRDLVDAYKRPTIPEGAFNKEQFAHDTGRTISNAGEILRRLFDNGRGKLNRVQVGKEFFYWPKGDE